MPGEDFARLKAARYQLARLMSMRRVLVIGCSGAGKSTLAKPLTATQCRCRFSDKRRASGTPPPRCSISSPTSSAIRNSCRCAARSRSGGAFQEPEGVEIIVADMTVAYKFVRETFSSRVTLDRPNLQILVEYLEGPFSHLENRWTFHPVGRAGLRRRILHRLRVQEPHARHADGMRCSTSHFAASRMPSSSAPTAFIAGKRGLTSSG